MLVDHQPLLLAVPVADLVAVGAADLVAVGAVEYMLVVAAAGDGHHHP